MNCDQAKCVSAQISLPPLRYPNVLIPTLKPQRECEELFFMSNVLLTQLPRVGGFVTSWLSAGHTTQHRLTQTHRRCIACRMPNEFVSLEDCRLPTMDIDSGTDRQSYTLLGVTSSICRHTQESSRPPRVLFVSDELIFTCAFHKAYKHRH
jgi:hypothetical protein